MRYVIATLICIAIIGGLTALVPYMTAKMQFYIHAGVVIPYHDRLLLGIAVFWRNFWSTLAPLIVVAVFGITALLHRD